MPPRKDINSIDSNDNSCASNSSCFITSAPINSKTTSQPTPTEITMTNVLSQSSSLPYTTMTTTATATATTTPTTATTSNISASELVAEQRNQLYVANAKLCRLVQKCPWMYDRSHLNYAKKQILDRSWMKIAKNCNDSVASCKERWRNIRAAFARSINVYKTHGGPNRVKPYYLHSELRFLIKPMMNSRNRSKSDGDNFIKTDESEYDPEDDIVETTVENIKEEAEKNESNANDVLVMSIDETDDEHAILEQDPEFNINFENIDENIFKELARKYVKDNQIRRDDQEIANEVVENRRRDKFIPKPKQINHLTIDEDSDAKFFEALLPDMKVMNAYQKIVFKRKIYQSLQEVFENKDDNQSFASAASTQNFVGKIDKMNRNDLLTLSKYIEDVLLRRHMTERDQQPIQLIDGSKRNANDNMNNMVRIPAQPRNVLDHWMNLGDADSNMIKEEIDMDR